ncbi:hypothetical protein [Paraferrimonas sp. SM1919]|uniref:hypothetical protein n=1 Tax=Paraferrimonas sp. SM1919 TaxID=2662263 RepID=UPI0013D7937C|nr:hypothetical protein [Paraferrimonas sp. SM1919]
MSQTQRLKFQFQLNPEQYQSDKALMLKLKRWSSETRKLNNNSLPSNIAEDFHKKVYKAGLLSYLVNPEFCQSLGNALVKQDLSQALQNTLESHEIIATQPELSLEQISHQLKSLQGQENNAQLDEVLEVLKRQHQQQLEAIENLYKSQIDTLSAQLKAQQKLISNLSSGAKVDSTMPQENQQAQSDLSETMAKVAKIKAKGLW